MARVRLPAYNARIVRARAHRWLVPLALVLGGCGGDEAALSLRLLFPVGVAEEPRAWLGEGCGTDRVLGQCVAIKMSACAPDTGECNSVLGDEAEGGTLADIQGGDFDLPTKTATREDLLLQIGMYGDGELMGTGEARGVTFEDGESVILTVFPVGDRAACGEPGGDETKDLTKRAFHTATLLPDGKVLIAGGLSGPIIRVTPATNALEDSIDVLDPRTGVVQHFTAAEGARIDNQAPDEAGHELYRAFHQAAYIGTDDQGRYVVRVIGGIRAQSGGQVKIDNSGADIPLQLLLAGGPTDADNDPAPPVDVHYDPGGSTVTITAPDSDGEAYPQASFAGFAALTDTLGSETTPGGASRGWYIGGGLGEYTAQQKTDQDIPQMLDGFVMNANGGTENPTPDGLLTGRVGAAVLGIGDDDVLIWGGNIWSVEDTVDTAAANEALAEELAEIHHLDGASPPDFVTFTGTAVPLSTSFHAAVVAAVDGDIYRIVAAGGYRVGPLEALFPSNLDLESPFYLVSYDKTRASAVVTPVDCGNDAGCAELVGTEGVAFMTATWIAPGRVFLAGGNFAYPGGGNTTRYAARALAGVVTVTGDTAVFERIDLGLARYGHTATRLLDGSVLILGGVTLPCKTENAAGDCTTFGDITPLGSYEVFNEGLEFIETRACE